MTAVACDLVHDPIMVLAHINRLPVSARTDVRTDRSTDGRMDRQTDGWMDGHADNL